MTKFTFPNLTSRLKSITRAGQREVEDKIDIICGLIAIRRGSELFYPYGQRPDYDWKDVRMIFSRIDRLLTYYEVKEATTLFELAIWKSKMDQEEVKHVNNRDVYRIDIPGPVKNTILHYLDFRL